MKLLDPSAVSGIDGHFCYSCSFCYTLLEQVISGQQLRRLAAGRAAAKPEDAPAPEQLDRPVIAEKDGGYESDTEEGTAAAGSGSPSSKRQKTGQPDPT